MIDVVGAQDVVLAEVGADLHLDDLDGHLARVLEPVPLRCEDVDALVFAHELLFFADDDLGRALDDDPMLRAMMVHLHRQLAAGLDVQQLDLEARSDVERLEIAPRPVIAEVLLMLLAVRTA